MGDHGDMELRGAVAVDDSAPAAFAQRNGVRRLAAFGSILRDDFCDDSDVDLLVEFEPGHVPGLLSMAAMELELEEMLGREVDLRTIGDLSRYFRNDVAATARELYAAKRRPRRPALPLRRSCDLRQPHRDRPMRILWKLEHELPADIFHAARVATG